MHDDASTALQVLLSHAASFSSLLSQQERLMFLRDSNIVELKASSSLVEIPHLDLCVAAEWMFPTRFRSPQRREFGGTGLTGVILPGDWELPEEDQTPALPGLLGNRPVSRWMNLMLRPVGTVCLSVFTGRRSGHDGLESDCVGSCRYLLNCRSTQERTAGPFLSVQFSAGTSTVALQSKTLVSKGLFDLRDAQNCWIVGTSFAYPKLRRLVEDLIPRMSRKLNQV